MLALVSVKTKFESNKNRKKCLNCYKKVEAPSIFRFPFTSNLDII